MAGEKHKRSSSAPKHRSSRSIIRFEAEMGTESPAGGELHWIPIRLFWDKPARQIVSIFSDEPVRLWQQIQIRAPGLEAVEQPIQARVVSCKLVEHRVLSDDLFKYQIEIEVAISPSQDPSGA
ncbi:MAG: hypothetical protein ACXWPM_10480 [Bdellovibrionota bacterium]